MDFLDNKQGCTGLNLRTFLKSAGTADRIWLWIQHSRQLMRDAGWITSGQFTSECQQLKSRVFRVHLIWLLPTGQKLCGLQKSRRNGLSTSNGNALACPVTVSSFSNYLSRRLQWSDVYTELLVYNLYPTQLGRVECKAKDWPNAIQWRWAGLLEGSQNERAAGLSGLLQFQVCDIHRVDRWKHQVISTSDGKVLRTVLQKS